MTDLERRDFLKKVAKYTLVGALIGSGLGSLAEFASKGGINVSKYPQITKGLVAVNSVSSDTWQLWVYANAVNADDVTYTTRGLGTEKLIKNPDYQAGSTAWQWIGAQRLVSDSTLSQGGPITVIAGKNGLENLAELRWRGTIKGGIFSMTGQKLSFSGSEGDFTAEIYEGQSIIGTNRGNGTPEIYLDTLNLNPNSLYTLFVKSTYSNGEQTLRWEFRPSLLNQ